MELASLYWYAAFCGWLFFTGIGIPPLPEELTIVWAGITSAAHYEVVYWWLAWPACIVGIVAADMVLYGAGRYWGKWLFEYRWVKRFLPPERRQHIEDGFHRHGVKILLTGRLLPGLRTGVFMTAGAIRYPFIRFLIADAIYAIPGVAFIFFGAYFLTDRFEALIRDVHAVQNWLLVAALVAGAGYGLYRYIRFTRARAAAEDFAPPSLPQLSGLRSKSHVDCRPETKGEGQPAATEAAGHADPPTGSS